MSIFITDNDINILPVLAEIRADCRGGAPHPWQTVTYSVANSPGAILLTPQMLVITVPVDWPAIVLLLSEDVVTQAPWPLLPGPPSGAEGEGPGRHCILHVHWI